MSRYKGKIAKDVAYYKDKFRVGTLVKPNSSAKTSNYYNLKNIKEAEIIKAPYKPNSWTKVMVHIRIRKGTSRKREGWSSRFVKQGTYIEVYADCLKSTVPAEPTWSLY